MRHQLSGVFTEEMGSKPQLGVQEQPQPRSVVRPSREMHVQLALVGEIIVHLNASHWTSYRILEELSGPGAPNPEGNINSEG